MHGHVQVDVNGYLPEVVAHDGSTFRLPAPPMQFGGVAAGARWDRHPNWGSIRKKLLLELGQDWEAIDELRKTGALG